MTFSDILNDNVTLLKKNGDKVEGIKASVQAKNIFINRSLFLSAYASAGFLRSLLSGAIYSIYQDGAG